MGLLQENERQTNLLVLKVLWGGAVGGLMMALILRLTGITDVDPRTFIVALPVGLIFLIATSALRYYYPEAFFIKYGIALSGIITVGVVMASSGEALQLSPLWFLVISLCSMYYDLKYIIAVGAVISAVNFFLVINYSEARLNIGSISDIISNPTSFTIAVFGLAFTAYQGRKFINKIMESEDKSTRLNSRMEDLLTSARKASVDVNTVSKNLSDNATNISATVEEVASSTNAFAANIRELAEKSNEMAESSREVTSKASKGQAEIKAALSQIETIRYMIMEFQQSVENLVEKIKNIGTMVATINEISSQTNLLALNAAIEAARAGSSGKGFAVVADEVRKLSEQAAESAQKIADIVEENDTEANATMAKIKSGVEQVKNSSGVIENAGTSFEDIMTAVASMIKYIEDIAAMGEDIEASGESIASSSEEQSVSVQEISELAQELLQTAGELHRHLEFAKET